MYNNTRDKRVLPDSDLNLQSSLLRNFPSAACVHGTIPPLPSVKYPLRQQHAPSLLALFQWYVSSLLSFCCLIRLLADVTTPLQLGILIEYATSQCLRVQDIWCSSTCIMIVLRRHRRPQIAAHGVIALRPKVFEVPSLSFDITNVVTQGLASRFSSKRYARPKGGRSKEMTVATQRYLCTE